jgi:hypothetical protein
MFYVRFNRWLSKGSSAMLGASVKHFMEDLAMADKKIDYTSSGKVKKALSRLAYLKRQCLKGFNRHLSKVGDKLNLSKWSAFK